MKYKELVKRASQTGAFLEREAEMEKVATVRRYMDYGLSFDVASALVKSAAPIARATKKIVKTIDKGVGATPTARATKKLAKTVDKGVGATTKKLAKTIDEGVGAVIGSAAKHSENLAKTVENGKKIWGAVTNPEAKEKEHEAASKLVADAKSRRQGLLAVGGGALGVGGLGGLAVGVNASRNKNKMPDYN